MNSVSSLGIWISENESLLSGAVAIIVMVSVFISVVGYLARRLSADRTETGKSADVVENLESADDSVITIKKLSAPSPYPVKFAVSDGLRIAFNEHGSGPNDVIVTPGIVSHLNLSSHMPALRDTFDAIAGFARVVCFDKRGQGLSDPTPRVPDLDERVHDIEAVMDGAGIDKAVLFGISEGGSMAIKFAHDHPERVSGLILLGTTASWLQRDDFPMGISGQALDSLVRHWGDGRLRDIFFPSISREIMDEKTYQAFERLIATRESIKQIVEFMKQVDVRPLLPGIVCPALVLHFGGDLAVPIRLGRAIADAIPDAEFMEVNAVDHADLSNSPEAIARIREFLSGLS